MKKLPEVSARRVAAALTIAWCSVLGARAAQAQTAPAASLEQPAAPVEPAAQAAPLAPVTLSALLDRASRHADTLKVARASEQIAQWQQYRADRAWVPKLQANTLLAPVPANTDPNRINENLDEILSLNIGPFVRQTLRLVVPVYTFGRISSAQDLAQLGVESAALATRKERVELAFQVRRAYYSAQLGVTFASMIEEGEDMLQARLREMEDARDFGDASFKIRDYRRLQIFEAEFKGRALDNQRLVTMSLSGLKLLTGQQLQAAQIEPLREREPLPALQPLDFYQALALKQRPDLQQLERALRARQAQVALARSEFFPTFFFAGDLTYGWSTERIADQRVCRVAQGSQECINVDDLFTRPFANPYNQFAFGVTLGLTWSFDYGQLYGQYQEAQARQAQTQAQRALALGALALELERLHLEAQQARQKVDIQADRLLAARRWRDQLGLGAQQGGDPVDAIEPVRAYYEARLLFLQSLYAYHMARAELAQAVGVLSLEEHEPKLGPR